MMEFAVQTTEGAQIVGVALTAEEIESLKEGDKSVYVDMTKHRMGIWRRKGKQRLFLQPRKSHIMVIHAENEVQIGERLGVAIPKGTVHPAE